MTLYRIWMEQMPFPANVPKKNTPHHGTASLYQALKIKLPALNAQRTARAMQPGTAARPAAAPAAPPAQGNTSTQWEGPDQTKDTTTVMVCLADGTRQVSPSLPPMSPDTSDFGMHCLSLVSFVLKDLHGTSRQHQDGV